jgi:hypothetical protein
MIDEEVETVLREIRERVISATPEPTRRAARGGANGNQTSQLRRLPKPAFAAPRP